MDPFDELAVLVPIVDEGSLAAVALAALEERAGARLLEQLWLRRCYMVVVPTSPTSLQNLGTWKRPNGKKRLRVPFEVFQSARAESVLWCPVRGRDRANTAVGL